MGYLLFEIVIFVSWAYVFLSRIRGARLMEFEDLHVLVFAIPTTILMEQRQNCIQSGSFYPSSLIFFPGYHFPIAIIFAGSLYAWGIYAITRAVATRIANRTSILFHLVHLGLFLVFLLTSRLVESFSVGIGYWQWFRMPDARTMLIGSYIYYFWFAFPAFLAAKFFSWHSKHTSRQPAIAGKPAGDSK